MGFRILSGLVFLLMVVVTLVSYQWRDDPPDTHMAVPSHPHEVAATCVPEYWEEEGLQEDGRLRINFPLALTTRSLKIKSVKDLPLFKFFLPSLATTIDPADFHYSVYLGIDQGDPFLDKCDHIKEVRQAWRKLLPRGVHIPLQFLIFANTVSRNTWATNYATYEAYQRGWDYFYRVNDDTTLMSRHWSYKMTAALKNMTPIPNLGSVAPMDKNYVNVHTHSMVRPILYETWTDCLHVVLGTPKTLGGLWFLLSLPPGQ